MGLINNFRNFLRNNNQNSDFTIASMINDVSTNNNTNIKQMKEQSNNKQKQKDPSINVIISTHSNSIIVLDEDYRILSKIPIAGFSRSGFFEEVYDKRNIIQTQKEILRNYLIEHPNIQISRDALMEKIEKNIDISVYSALFDYDLSSYYKTNTVQQYIDALLVDVQVPNSTDKMVKQRTLYHQRELLNKAGITLEYDFSGIPHTSFRDILHIISNYLKTKNFSDITIFGKTFFAKPVNKVVKYEDYIKSQNSTLKAKQKQKVKTKRKYVSKNPSIVKKRRLKLTLPNISESLKKKLRRGFYITGAVGFVGAATLFSSKFMNNSNINTTPASVEYETLENTTNSINETVTSTLSDASIKVNIPETNSYNDFSDSTIDEAAISNTQESENFVNSDIIESNDIVESLNTTETPSIVESNKNDVDEKIILQDALLEAFDCGIGSDCIIDTGTYYEISDGSGKSGNFEKFKGSDMAVNIIAAIEDGKCTTYNSCSIQEIKSQHPDADLSYHIISADTSKIAGWAKEEECDIENKLVKSALMDIKSELSIEEMQFLCNTPLDSEVNKKELEPLLEHIQEIQQSQSIDDIEEDFQR